MLGDQIGPRFEAQPSVVEVSDGERLERLAAACRRDAARPNADGFDA
jgi:hypothetical protein